MPVYVSDPLIGLLISLHIHIGFLSVVMKSAQFNFWLSDSMLSLSLCLRKTGS